MGVFQNVAAQQSSSGGGGVFNKVAAAQVKPPVIPGVVGPAEQATGRAQLAAAPTALRDVATGAAKGSIRGVEEGIGGLARLGGVIESGLDQTLGRGANILAVKGNVPTNTATGATQGADALTAASQLPVVQPKNTAEKVGGVIGQGADLLVTPPTGKVAGKGAELLGSGLEKGVGTVGELGQKIGAARAAGAAQKEGQAVIDLVSPKLTAKQTSQALLDRGATKQGVLRSIKLNNDPEAVKIADAVKKNVPEFNTGKSIVENINATQAATDRLANQLKSKVIASGKDVIYPFKELASRMKAIEKPISIKADSTLNRQFDLAQQAALRIAQQEGGKISNLFDARKAFDVLVKKEFPNLYDKENAPMRAAISSMRHVMNDFIEEKLPADVGFKGSLKTQSQLLDAIENMSDRAASGASKEVGTNAIERATSAIKNHPVLSGMGGIAAYETAKKIPIIGGLLP